MQNQKEWEEKMEAEMRIPMSKKEELMLMLRQVRDIAEVIHSIETFTHSTMRELYDLRERLERHAAACKDECSPTNEYVSGSLRVSSGPRPERDSPPTKKQ